MDVDRPVVADLVAAVATAVSGRAAIVSANVYEVTNREIPELHDDQAVLALFASSIDSNVTTCLQIMRHQIDLADVHAPAAALEEARRRAQRGTALTALLRAYRLGHTVFLDWVFQELARQSQDAALVTAVTIDVSKIVAGYIDQVCEEIVGTYARERERWLRNRSAARAGRIRDLLSGQPVNVSATEATLGYRLRQHHLGVVCWTSTDAIAAGSISRLERAVGHIAARTAAGADPVFLPRDESSAWAWLPLGIRDRFDADAARAADLDGDLHVAFGDVARGIDGFRLSHQQALAAQAVALAGGSPPRVVTYGEVAPVAMMLSSAALLRAWVLATLGRLATDDEHHARLRETLLVFLDTGGSYKATAERLLLHKNSVQYRIHKATESLGRPVGDNRHDVELALQACRWLGSTVLARPSLSGGAAASCRCTLVNFASSGLLGLLQEVELAEYPKEITQRLLGTAEQNATALVGARPARWDHIVIEDYDPAWVDWFAAARALLRDALGDQIITIEHVGSTSVPGLPAKSIIDIDLTLDDTADESRYVPALEARGYRLVLREPWWHGHRMLVSAAEDVHLHLWPQGAAEPVRHLLFRDWLRSHPEDRELYASAKRRLAAETAERPAEYNMAKNDVIDQIYERIFAAGT